MYDVEMEERKCTSYVITDCCNDETHQEKESNKKLDHSCSDAKMMYFCNVSDFFDKNVMMSYELDVMKNLRIYVETRMVWPSFLLCGKEDDNNFCPLTFLAYDQRRRRSTNHPGLVSS